MDFVPHRAVWTREKSSRFWDQLSSLAGGDENYFSAEVGDSLIRFARVHGADLSGRVLDFGCGPGHLVRKLLAVGVKAEGADFSPTSIERLRQLAANNPRFGGATVIESIPSSLPSDTYSTVFFVETIEHLLDDDLKTTLAELYRLVRPGGTVVISTPNDEKLQTGDTVCPDCGCVFHRVQHVRSWSATSIAEALSQYGFEKVVSKSWFLDAKWWKSRVVSHGARTLGIRLPHLIYVGRKPATR